jgi:1,4-dihydroxy-2-naphthoate octaprenyltransferase
MRDVARVLAPESKTRVTLPMIAAPPPANADTSPLVRSGSVRAWGFAVRPKTLLVAISPVLVGATLGFQLTGMMNVLVVLIVLGAAVLMQVATNLQNDVGYTVRGGEQLGALRTGLPRATARGWLRVGQVRAGIVLVGTIAFALGLMLAAYRGWPVLVIGAASLTAALAYMGGPKPIAYTPFGELTVFVFFGLVAVAGTEWVLSGRVGVVGVLAAITIGGLAAAALAVNNHRDIEHDRLAGRRTFAVVAGEAASRRMYGALLLGPFPLVVAMSVRARAASLLLPLVLLPVAVRLLRDFMRCPRGIEFNEILFRTFRLEFWFAMLLSAGLLLLKIPA